MKYPSWSTIAIATALSLTAIAPAIAQDTTTPEGTGTPPETTVPATTTPNTTESTSTDYSQSVKGTIKSIIGSLVIVDLADGGTRTLTLDRDDIARYSLAPGMYLVATEKNGMTVVESATYAAAASSESATASRILNIKAPVVSSETSSSTTESTTYTESPPPTTTTTTTTTTVETTSEPEALPPTPRALW